MLNMDERQAERMTILKNVRIFSFSLSLDHEHEIMAQVRKIPALFRSGTMQLTT
jgi:hypothetical protein